MKVLTKLLLYFGLIEDNSQTVNYMPGTDDYADKNHNTFPITSTAHAELEYPEPTNYMID